MTSRRSTYTNYGVRDSGWQERGEWAWWMLALDRLVTVALAGIVTGLLVVLFVGRLT